jgi:hypothetical protein
MAFQSHHFGFSDFSDALQADIASPELVAPPDLGPVSLETGTTAAATATATATAKTALYLEETGTTAPISISDLNQGQLGDCFLISSIGELVLTDPSAITNMIKTNANGTETVTLYGTKAGGAVTSITSQLYAKTETVTNVFSSASVDNGASQDVLNGVKEIWPQVLEEAVANLGGGYASIANGGSPILAMEELTGKEASFLSQSQIATQLTVAKLQSLIAAGDMLVFDTSVSSATYNLVGSHAYMFEAMTGSGSSAMVKLGNPWGFDQPNLVPVSALSKAFAEVDIGHA